METFCPFHCSANLKRFKQLGEILGAPLLLCVYVSRSHGACAVFHTIQVAAQSSVPGSNRDSVSSIYSVSDRKNWDLTKKVWEPTIMVTNRIQCWKNKYNSQSYLSVHLPSALNSKRSGDQVKFWHALCVHRTTMHQFTVSLYSKPHYLVCM